MTDFEYASPRTEADAVELLGEHGSDTTILAAGTDLVPLLQKDVVRPRRVVDISGIDSLRGVDVTADGVVIGVLTTLEEMHDSAALADYPTIADVIREIRAIQIQQNGTLGGDLCHLPNCWYFRNGYGLLAREGARSVAEAGDNRYHAIFGNQGPAKFVSASRFAPGLIALDALVRIAGSGADEEQWMPLEEFYITPNTEQQGISVLRPGQFITHVQLPPVDRVVSASYEVLEMRGLDWPLCACGVAVERDELGLVRRAKVVLGQVAPTPWVSPLASSMLIGQPITPEIAQRAGDAAAVEATPLKDNEYKVQLARTSVKRALLRAVGELPEGL